MVVDDRLGAVGSAASMMPSAISSSASSQEMRFHLPAPRSPTRFERDAGARDGEACRSL